MPKSWRATASPDPGRITRVVWSTRLAGVGRNGAVDLLRFAAAVIIMLFHLRGPGGWLMPVAMGIFAGLLTYHVALGTRADRTWAEAIRGRARRLLTPFAIWMAISLVLVTADAVVTGGSVVGDLRRWFPPDGTMAQLWFLPWAFVVSGVVLLAQPHLHRAPDPASLGLLMIAATLALQIDGLGESGGWPPGWAVLIAYLPAALIGWVFALQARRPLRLILTALLALAIGLVAVDPVTRAQLFLGMPLVAGALLAARWAAAGPVWLADLSMGLYLTHVTIYAVLLRVLPEGTSPVTFALVTGTIAAAVTLTARHVPSLRPLLGMPRRTAPDRSHRDMTFAAPSSSDSAPTVKPDRRSRAG